MDKHRIQHSFAQAAPAYDQHARMQREAAAALTLRMQRHWPEAHRILEIGCGTGNLTRHLLATYPQAQLLATDLAPSMVATCQTLLPPADRPRVQFEAADGEQLDATGFDLVASSLVFQWFEDTPATLRRVQAQGARVAVATLVDGTFQEWKDAHAQLGLADGVRPFVSEGALRELATELQAHVEFDTLYERYDDAKDFVRAIKGIGAGTPRPGHQPAPLGRVLRQFPQGITVSYRVAYWCAEPASRA